MRQRGVAARYGKAFAGAAEDLEKIVARFENAAINDPVDRVARDPQRKLAANERLVGAARLAEAAGIFPEQLALATAAALYFRSVQSKSGPAQQAELAAVLNQICGLDTAKGFGKIVANSWAQLAPGTSSGNLLLSLTSPMWSLA